jgi:flagellar biosynthesis protein FlhG
MDDQANDLRQLVVRSAAPQTSSAGGRPTLVVLSGGKGGVGTTTLAVNLAVAAAQKRLLTILVDADPRGGHASILCGLRERYTLADVLANRRRIADVLHPGPCGLQVLPGIWGWEKLSAQPPAAAQRVLDQLCGLGALADLVVLDAGNNSSPAVQRFWLSADLVFAVTSPETASILGTYAAIKVLAKVGEPGKLHCLVNLAPGAKAAGKVHGRLAQACRRLLGLNLNYGGHVSADPRVAGAGHAHRAFVIAASRCLAARQVRRLAARLATTVGQKRSAAVPAAAKRLRQFRTYCEVKS